MCVCIYIYIYIQREREREREREAFVSGKIEIMHGIREGMTILQYEDKNKKSKKQRKIKRQNNSNIESSGDMKS